MLVTLRAVVLVRETAPAHLGQLEDIFLGDAVVALLFYCSKPLLLFPLVVPPAELAVPALRGLEIGHLAESLGLRPDVLFRQQDFVIYFGVECELHLTIGGATSALFSLAAILLPAEKVAAGDAVPFGYFFGVDSFEDLSGLGNTCFTASSFSLTVYLR